MGDLNVGKSLVLCYVGGQAVRQGRHVLHVTLEMSRARTLARYFANLSDEEDNITYTNIVNFSPEEEVFSYVHDTLKGRYEGYLQVEDFPSGKCGIGDLYNLLDKYPDTELLLVDYLGLLKPVVRRKEIRHELSDLATSLRAIAIENNLHVMAPTQANKLASGKRIVDVGKTAEDYGIQRIADFTMAIGQTQDDVIKNELVAFIARSRNSKKFTAERYRIDFPHMKIQLIRQETLNGH